jgi:O-antigen/teichoic acid export membrane protein
MLSLWMPASVVGLYAAAAKLIDVVLLLPILLAHFMLPKLARAFAGGQPVGRGPIASLAFLLAVVAPLGLGLLLFAAPILRMLFGPGFEVAAPILRVLSVCLIVESVDILVSVVLKAAGRQHADVRMFALNPVSNTVLNIFLIPGLGSVGAAVSKLAAVSLSFTLRYSFLSTRVLGPSRPGRPTPSDPSAGVDTAGERAAGAPLAAGSVGPHRPTPADRPRPWVLSVRHTVGPADPHRRLGEAEKGRHT